MDDWNGIKTAPSVIDTPLSESEYGDAAAYLEEASDFTYYEWRRVILRRIAVTLRHLSKENK